MAASKTIGKDGIDSVGEGEKLSGRIDFKCTDFATLASAEGNFEKLSEEKLFTRGLTWRILVEKSNNSIGIYVICQNEANKNGSKKENRVWSCSANIDLRLHHPPKKRDGNNLLFESYVHRKFSHNFHANNCKMGFSDDFDKLQRANAPLVDENGTLRISAEIRAEEPRAVYNYVTRPDVLWVNGEEVRVNKYHLACKSHHFESFFFGEDSKNTKVELELPANVEHFKRMLDAMDPQNRHLDDQCIEGVFHLANQFLLGEVEAKCRNFLSRWSKRSAMFKYRLADKYGYAQLKNEILDASKMEEFFKKADFVENLQEYSKMDGKAREELDTRLCQVFGKSFAGDA